MKNNKFEMSLPKNKSITLKQYFESIQPSNIGSSSKFGKIVDNQLTSLACGGKKKYNLRKEYSKPDTPVIFNKVYKPII